MSLPVVRSGERATYKRCVKKWYWAWRKGLVLKAKKFGALELGTWWHSALSQWYRLGTKRNGGLPERFEEATDLALSAAVEDGAPDYLIEQAEELVALGLELARSYELEYGRDKTIRVLAVEVTLEFTFNDPSSGLAINHRITPDLIFMDQEGRIWLMEHKTAKSIRIEHLVIDDQARPYSAMARRGLIKAGIIQSNQDFAGMLYNFTRKALPDLRQRNEKGQYLNKNGSVSKRQPAPFFKRHPVILSRKAKIITLNRVRSESLVIAEVTLNLKSKKLDAADLPKTPHWSCPKTCDFFDMCVAEEQGGDIRTMEKAMFDRVNPYELPESADEPVSFEMG